MAAHAVTGLNQCISYVGSRTIGDDPKRRQQAFDYIRPALELSCWTEDIAHHWLALRAAVKDKDVKALYRALILALPDAIAEWESYGFPETREDWIAAKYPGLEDDCDSKE